MLEGFGGMDELPCRSIYTQHSPGDFGLSGRNPWHGSDASYFLARLSGAEGDVYVSAHTILSDRYDGRVITGLQIMEEQPLETGMVQVDISAEAVADYLVSEHGVDSGRLTTRGLGPWAPAASNEDEDGRARNRRVELIKAPE